MALVIPNAPYYVNDLKPFVPDFKFLGDVLQKRQGAFRTMRTKLIATMRAQGTQPQAGLVSNDVKERASRMVS